MQYSLKHLFGLTTIAAIATAIMYWCGLLLGLFTIINLLLLATWFIPTGTSVAYWGSLFGGAIILYILYESMIPPGMNIRVDLLLLYFMVALSVLIRVAKYGDAALSKRRLTKPQNVPESLGPHV